MRGGPLRGQQLFQEEEQQPLRNNSMIHLILFCIYNVGNYNIKELQINLQTRHQPLLRSLQGPASQELDCSGHQDRAEIRQ
jgi:hypothetical protein